MTNTDQLREQLAAIEHERWSDWMVYMFDCAIQSGTDEGIGYRTAGWPKAQYESWKRQMETAYSELSEAEKQSDRDQVDRYWHLIEQHTATAVRAARQDDLINFLDNPETINKAVEGSMDKRLQALPTIHTELHTGKDGYSHYFINGLHNPNLCPECVFPEATHAIIERENLRVTLELMEKHHIPLQTHTLDGTSPHVKETEKS